MNCLILEDQLAAQRILVSYLERLPDLQLVGCYIDPLESLPLLREGKADVIFLDIQLPRLSGIDILEALRSDTQVIVTTAFEEYALKGYEYDVVDYLLKPFSFERFLTAVGKLKTSPMPAAPPKELFVRDRHTIRRVSTEAVTHVEAQGDFVLIHLKDGSRCPANATLKDILLRLGPSFVRCHKSYAINLTAVDRLTGNVIHIEKQAIPIGRKYREDLLQKMGPV